MSALGAIAVTLLGFVGTGIMVAAFYLTISVLTKPSVPCRMCNRVHEGDECCDPDCCPPRNVDPYGVQQYYQQNPAPGQMKPGINNEPGWRIDL